MIERWLKRIIAEVLDSRLTKLDEALAVERRLLAATAEQVSTIALTVQSHVDAVCKAAADASLEALKAKMRQSTDELLKDEPGTWSADADQVKADHHLRHPLPTRR
jgi:hypothetical protein